MRVKVLFFGRLKEIVGREQDLLELPEGASVEQLFRRYGAAHPQLAAFRPSLVASVNQEFAAWEAPLRGGDEVAFLPPVSGGAPEPRGATAVAEDIFELVRVPIVAGSYVAHVKAPECGAVCVFDGIVRDHSAGRRTLYLEYEAYAPMALRQMQAIGQQLRARFPIHRVVMVHRLGRLEIGETSVLIVVSAAHRAAAFDACRLAIDTLKRSVPIWKRECFADGSAWAEGEQPAAPTLSRRDESIG